MPDSNDPTPAPPSAAAPLDSLRSARWFAPDDLRAFGHRSRVMQMGYAPRRLGRQARSSRIVNTWTDINPCHAHFKQRVEDVKRGVLQAGGFPLELPAHLAGRDLRQADDHALPQLAGDGGRGAAALAPGRRRGADGRLRQDHARPADGRDQRRPARASTCRPGRCCAATGRARCSARARDAWKYWDERRAGKHDDDRVDRASKAASRAATAPA